MLLLLLMLNNRYVFCKASVIFSRLGYRNYFCSDRSDRCTV